MTPKRCFAIFALLLAATAFAQTTVDADIAARADAYMSALAKQQRFNGAILMAKDGRVLFKKGYGMANFEWDIPNAPSTKFRLGSITKQFTSLCIMQLEERGLLKVDDPIGKYLTDYPKPAADKVTIHHLLTHTSGIPSYTDDPTFFPKRSILPLTVKEMIDTFKDKPLDFEPGSKFHYDNSGYFLLGAIIEKITGKKYETYLQENIFGPLGMRDSGYDHPTPILKNRASGYEMRDGAMINAPYLDMGLPYAAGSLYSTVEDLYLWDQALYTEKLVKRASLDRIYTPRIKMDGPADAPMYGYGWGIATVKGHKNVGHGGGINGFGTYISRFPEDHAVFIYLRNVTSGMPQSANNDLAGILFGEKVEPLKEKTAVSVNPAILDKLVGKYEMAPAFSITVTREGDRLFAQATNQPKFELFPMSETRWFLKVVDADVEFRKNDKGEVDGAVLHQGGRDLPGKRVP
jgi:CubicO group peptidase (beta-lactamase class C family)